MTILILKDAMDVSKCFMLDKSTSAWISVTLKAQKLSISVNQCVSSRKHTSLTYIKGSFTDGNW